jgi:hypothetical protein
MHDFEFFWGMVHEREVRLARVCVDLTLFKCNFWNEWHFLGYEWRKNGPIWTKIERVWVVFSNLRIFFFFLNA